MGEEMHAAAGDGAEQIAVPGAGHYFEGTPDLLEQALDGLADWVTRKVGR
jgi:fermentation-respiration switch protein FrsA (DUF1100 family)